MHLLAPATVAREIVKNFNLRIDFHMRQIYYAVGRILNFQNFN